MACVCREDGWVLNVKYGEGRSYYNIQIKIFNTNNYKLWGKYYFFINTFLVVVNDQWMSCLITQITCKYCLVVCLDITIFCMASFPRIFSHLSLTGGWLIALDSSLTGRIQVTATPDVAWFPYLVITTESKSSGNWFHLLYQKNIHSKYNSHFIHATIWHPQLAIPLVVDTWMLHESRNVQ